MSIKLITKMTQLLGTSYCHNFMKKLVHAIRVLLTSFFLETTSEASCNTCTLFFLSCYSTCNPQLSKVAPVAVEHYLLMIFDIFLSSPLSAKYVVFYTFGRRIS